MQPNQIFEAISQNLPPEILAIIFTMICEKYVRLPPRPDRYPWILGHICSYWRAILWNTHSIWRNIVVGIPHPFPTGSSRIAKKRTITEMLAFILEKIDCPISLVTHQRVDFYLNIIVKQPERFSELILFNASKEAILRLLDLPPEAFPVLERLTVGGPSTGHYLIFNAVTSPFRTAPKLRSIAYTYNCKYIRWQVDSPITFTTTFPWLKLEEVAINSVALPLTEIHHIWKICPNLRFCSFKIRDSGKVPSNQQIILSALQTLRLTTYDIHEWDDILRPIVAPALQNLHIDTPKLPIPRLVSLISRSRCLLKTICIHEDNSDNEEITGSAARDLFHHIPAATKFTVSRTLSTSAVQSISDGGLPDLARVGLRVSPEGFSSLLDMIDVYLDQSQSLPSFKILCNGGPGFDEVQARYHTRHGAYKVEGVKIIATSGIITAGLYEDSDSDDSDLFTVEEDDDSDSDEDLDSNHSGSVTDEEEEENNEDDEDNFDEE